MYGIWIWCVWIFVLFAVSYYPFPLPGVHHFTSPRFSGAERHLHWEVAPARLADDAVVDLWSWHNVSFTTPGYGPIGAAGEGHGWSNSW